MHLERLLTVSPSDLRNLVQGRTARLSLLALITVLAAVSRTALANFIAYEAYLTDDTAGKTNLRLQSMLPTSPGSMLGASHEAEYWTDQLKPTDKNQLLTQVSAMLNSLPTRNMSSALVNSAYAAGNITKQSLDNLPSSVIRLEGIPAYRLSISCFPDVPNRMNIHSMGGDSTDIDLFWDTANGIRKTEKLTATYPGTPSEIGGRNRESMEIAFTAFNPNASEVYLGLLTRFNLTKRAGPSTSYGPLRYRAFNMSSVGGKGSQLFNGTQRIMSIYGLRCSLFRELGYANYTRLNTSGSVSGWEASQFTFAADQQKVNVPSLLYPYQGNNLNFHLPGQWTPGIGPAFLPINRSKIDTSPSTLYPNPLFFPFDEAPLKFLYASGETQRIIHEISALNTSVSNNAPQMFIEVTSISTAEHYRMTLVPSLLLVGLLSLACAGIITIGMMSFTWASKSAETSRRVDGVRLLVDSALNLKGHEEQLLQLARSSNAEIDAWAARYKVRYSAEDADGTTTVVLKKG